MVEYTKPGVKRSFVDLKIAPKTEAGRNFEAVFEGLWRNQQPLLRSFFAASLPVRVAGSIKRIMLTTPMKYESFTHFNRCHQHFPNLSKSIDMGIPEGW